jgi:hypothetical protein
MIESEVINLCLFSLRFRIHIHIKRSTAAAAVAEIYKKRKIFSLLSSFVVLKNNKIWKHNSSVVFSRACDSASMWMYYIGSIHHQYNRDEIEAARTLCKEWQIGKKMYNNKFKTITFDNL